MTLRAEYDIASAAFPVDAKYDLFDHPEWLAASAVYVQSLRNAARKGELAIEPYLLPAAWLCAEIVRSSGRLCVLDFGGGVGPCVDPLLSVLPENTDCTYDVVDSLANCKRGRELFADTPAATFSPEIPAGIRPDLVLASALQYVKDWRGLIKTLTGLAPTYIHLARLPVSDGYMICLRQNIFSVADQELDQKLLGSAWSWVFHDGIDGVLADSGYTRIFDVFIRDMTPELPRGIRPAHVRARTYRASQIVAPAGRE
jgi:putative methyltransferase (TIGR04325 family)